MSNDLWVEFNKMLSQDPNLTDYQVEKRLCAELQKFAWLGKARIYFTQSRPFGAIEVDSVIFPFQVQLYSEAHKATMVEKGFSEDQVRELSLCLFNFSLNFSTHPAIYAKTFEYDYFTGVQVINHYPAWVYG